MSTINDQGTASGADPLKEVREGEHELAEAREAEERAESHLKKAIEKLEHPEHDKPHELKIIVNGREKVWAEDEISYEQLVVIANLPLPPGPTESVRDLMLRVTGIDIERCPLCQQGTLRLIAVLPPAPLPWDTS